MIRFSYSNEDIKDEGKEEGWVAVWARRAGCSAKSRACNYAEHPAVQRQVCTAAVAAEGLETRLNQK
jgi:hypothetical protein